MATQHYEFTELVSTNHVNLVSDTSTFLNEIDSALYDAESTLTAAIGDEATARESAIGDEVTARENAIAAEATARNNAIAASSADIRKQVLLRKMLDGKNAVIIGDSYSFGTGATGHHSTAEMDYGQYGQSLDSGSNRFTTQVCAKLNMTEYNYAVGTTGFVDPGSYNTTFYNQIENAASNLPADIIENVALVLITGGLNDAREGGISGSAMRTAAAACGNRAKALFSNAFVVFVPMLYPGTGYRFGATPYNFYDRIRKGAWDANCYVVQDGYTWLFGADSYTDDLHPSGSGHTVIAEFVTAGILGNATPTKTWDSPTFESGFSRETSGQGYVILDGDIVSFGGTVFTGSLASGNQKIAQLPRWAYPSDNQYGIVVKGNSIVGTFAVTSGGAVYCNVTSSTSTDFFASRLTWQVCGG